ncbi:MAG: ribonuclease III [Pontimonas sp.]
MSGLPEADAFDPRGLLDVLQVEIGSEILAQALTHSSYAYEQGGLDNERLEFLGDSVLGEAITVALYHQFPELPEGELAKARASIVSTTALAQVARGVELGKYLRLGRGEEITGGRDKPSLLADALEALFGALYVDAGSEKAHALIISLMGDLVTHADSRSEASDPKTALQEWAAAHQGSSPKYNISDTGPDHAKVFRAQVFLDSFPAPGTPAGVGEGSSKKAAELAAASEALAAVRGTETPSTKTASTTTASA